MREWIVEEPALLNGDGLNWKNINEPLATLIVEDGLWRTCSW